MTSAYSAPFQPHSQGRRPALKPQRMEPIEGQKESRHVATTPVTITAPCGTCAHEPVCNRIAGLKRLEQVNVEASALPAGLSVAISATVDCDAYLKAPRKSPAAVALRETAADEPKRGAAVWTPERRAAQSEIMRNRMGRQLATVETVETVG